MQYFNQFHILYFKLFTATQKHTFFSKSLVKLWGLILNRLSPSLNIVVSERKRDTIMTILKKHLIDKFQEHLEAQYDEYCRRHDIAKNEHQLIGYLIDQMLIHPTLLQKYTILREYEKINHESKCPKTQAVETLANRFNLSERTVWSILKHINTKIK